ncbi:hypothetical protein [uncultured Mucilaginibacter sp.]|uniref:hypothetical protein n=1 Tax=uncultured Mucilaginibacter sp. TaxID=797541 RepID=UPI00261F5D44|nr:hypothetical protein [uncultured Mucilaginibacter sp.]
MPPGGDPAFLTFWFFCVKTKERKNRAKTRYTSFKQTFVYLYLTFFLLEQKEPKIQDKPDPSGRFVGPFRAWAETCRFGTSNDIFIFAVERFFQMLLLSV